MRRAGSMKAVFAPRPSATLRSTMSMAALYTRCVFMISGVSLSTCALLDRHYISHDVRNNQTRSRGGKIMRRTLIAVFALLLAMPARAEVSEVRLSKQYGLPYLPFMVMEHFQLLEKQAEKQRVALKVSWTTLSNSSAMMEAIISGQMDFIAPGLPTLATMGDKTVGTQNEIRALTAVQSMPYVLVTRSPEIKTIRDFTARDRIALPAVKLTGHAIALQMAAAREWGREHYDKLDPITVSLSHPDATAALLAGKSEVTAHFATSPFYYIELANPA